MKSLGFPAASDGRLDAIAGMRIRRARFEARSGLPVGAACVVANGVRETLSALFDVSVVVRLFEPTVPAPDGWTAILRGARLYRVRGPVADAAIVLRPADAVALSSAIFGEKHREEVLERALSPIECDVLDRLVDSLAVNLGSVCGARDTRRAERVPAICGFVTYFELSIVEPVAARVGIALSRDPAPESGALVEVAHLVDVRLSLRATLDLGEAEVDAIARLAVGDVLPLGNAAFSRCTLTAFGQTVARGSGGVVNGGYAFSADGPRETA
jgi:flagellar motor switch/type III secretory pathway protein FliN